MAIWTEIAAAQRHAESVMLARHEASFDILTADNAPEIEALAAQIIPSSDGPGAREAGVVYFIDRALSTFDADKQQLYRAGLEAVEQKRGELFPASKSIAALTPEQQAELMRAIENTDFFDLLRTHTVLGFLGHPRYGGNRGGVGWRTIGFEDRTGFQPPFGYYDAHAGGSSE